MPPLLTLTAALLSPAPGEDSREWRDPTRTKTPLGPRLPSGSHRAGRGAGPHSEARTAALEIPPKAEGGRHWGGARESQAPAPRPGVPSTWPKVAPEQQQQPPLPTTRPRALQAQPSETPARPQHSPWRARRRCSPHTALSAAATREKVTERACALPLYRGTRRGGAAPPPAREGSDLLVYFRSRARAAVKGGLLPQPTLKPALVLPRLTTGRSTTRK